MAKKLRVEYDKSRCIGNGSCAAISPDYFELKGKKAKLLKSKKSEGIRFIEVECNNDDAKAIIDAGIACPVNAIRVIDIGKGQDIVSFVLNEKNAKKVIAEYDDAKDFVLDGKKYFLIRLDREKGNIGAAFCKGKNNVLLKVTGKKPLDIYQTILNKEKAPISKDHAAYLGKELQKAYIALTHNLEYVQDEELDFEKKHKV